MVPFHLPHPLLLYILRFFPRYVSFIQSYVSFIQRDCGFLSLWTLEILVRIAFPTLLPLNSSSDADDDQVCPTPRVKLYVEEIRFGETKPSSSSFKAARKARCKAEKGEGGERGIDGGGAKVLRGGDKGFFGPHSDSDRAAIRLKGHNAQTNFLTPPPPPSLGETPVIDLQTISGCDSGNQSLCSPTSVLRFNVKEETEYQTDLERKPIDLAAEVKPTVGAHVDMNVQSMRLAPGNAARRKDRECKSGNLENSHRFCNETCKETNLASLDVFSFRKSMFGSDFLEHVDINDVSPKSNTSL
ncbi:hypothetical protein IGI04_014572 [Brassica rapa subsp. trilocularis]|uniref:Uncharacterized protein n=1 Tax=Brassica rapa subsp. trilocularis TaxID=1813537 RepID=A0ABQ7MNA1_BRACM|nr:hypothetical protein IGI04_014572 [Brassica rapa subsp. trilocularis]